MKAETWPRVGDWVRQFRQAYQAAPEEPTWKPPKTEVVVVKAPARKGSDGHEGLGTIHMVEPGAAAGFSATRSEPLKSETLPLPRPILEHRWFLPGQPLFADKGSESSPEARLTSLARLPILTHDPPWAEVLLATDPLWVDTSRQPDLSEANGKGFKPRWRQRFRGHIEKRLSRAQELLRIEGPVRKIGDHALYSDTDDPRVFAQLEVMAGLGPPAYAARYGLSPAGPHDWGVVLFSREADYRKFAAESTSPRPDKANGHAEHGYLAFFLEGQTLAQFLITVAHEQTHLLNRNALADELPPWLEEGLATDLGSVWVEDLTAQLTDLQGRDKSEKVGGWEASMNLLDGYLKASDVPSLEGLMRLERVAFYQNVDWAYPYSAAFVRFLLDAENGRYAAKFQAFLKHIANGGKPEPSALFALLEVSGEVLDRNLRYWVTNEALLAKERLEKHRVQFYRDQWALEQHELPQETPSTQENG